MSVGPGRACEGIHTGEVWVVDLYVANALRVKDLQLFLVRFRNVGEVLLVVGVDLLGVGSSCTVAEVVLVVISKRLHTIEISLTHEGEIMVILMFFHSFSGRSFFITSTSRL